MNCISTLGTTLQFWANVMASTVTSRQCLEVICQAKKTVWLCLPETQVTIHPKVEFCYYAQCNVNTFFWTKVIWVMNSCILEYPAQCKVSVSICSNNNTKYLLPGPSKICVHCKTID